MATTSKQTAAPARAADEAPAMPAAEPAPVAAPVADAPALAREVVTLTRADLATMTTAAPPRVVGTQYDPTAKGAAVPPPPPAVAPLPPRAGDPDA